LSKSSSPSIVVDAHEDIAFAHVLGRDFLKDITQLRASTPKSDQGTPTVCLPELEKGNVRVVFATLWVAPCHDEHAPSPICYETPDEAKAQALDELIYYRKLEREGRIRIIKNKAQLKEHLEDGSDKRKVGFVILMEGADPIRFPKEAKEWFNAGVRIVGPAWSRTRYSGGTRAPGPLTKEGRELMGELESSGFILDTSHFAEESFYDALDLFHGPVIASHANCRVFTPTDRQLSDDMIRAVTSRDGVIGAVFYNKFLDPNWDDKKKIKSDVTFATVVKHMKHVSDLAGDKLHTAIGSDLDGGFGVESTPMELDTVADIQKLAPALRDAGFSEQDVQNALGRNWIRVLERALPES
jgi:membrane dipeptidase